MAKRVNKDELSAFVDGEAESPDALRERIEQCSHTAAEYAALARLSERMKQMPAPEVTASFADRVVAAIETAHPELVADARLSARLKALPEPEVSTAFAQRVVASIESEYADQVADARIAGRLQALPEPQVHPGFARRVVAAIESAGVRPARVWQFPARGAMLAAASIAILAGLAVFTPVSESPTTPDIVAAVPSVQEVAATLDESALLARIESRVANDDEVRRIVTARYESPAQPEDIYSDRLLSAFAGSPGVAAGEAFRHGADYRSALRTFDKEQTSAVKRLLEDSVQEAREG